MKAANKHFLSSGVKAGDDHLPSPIDNNDLLNWELLTVHLGITTFCYFLEGHMFKIFTDHEPLTFAISKLLEPWSECWQ